MNLQQLVIEMRAVALGNKLQPNNLVQELAKAIVGEAPQKRHELIDGHKMVIQLTYDVVPLLGEFWHLSFSIEGHESMPPELVEKVKTVFLGESPPILEIPSMWGAAVRQFLQKVEV